MRIKGRLSFLNTLSQTELNSFKNIAEVIEFYLEQQNDPIIFYIARDAFSANGQFILEKFLRLLEEKNYFYKLKPRDKDIDFRMEWKKRDAFFELYKTLKKLYKYDPTSEVNLSPDFLIDTNKGLILKEKGGGKIEIASDGTKMKLFNFLLQRQGQFIQAAELASRLKRSIKTLRADISWLNRRFLSQFGITKIFNNKKGSGYRIDPIYVFKRKSL